MKLQIIASLCLVFLAFVGCGKHADDHVSSSSSGHEVDAESGGFWCKEHGVPEKLCSLCMSAEEAKQKYQDKGDWCDEHKRAKSQCFKCDPKRYEYFAGLYRAKFGKEPPRPPESEFEK